MSELPPARRVELPDLTLSVHESGSGPAVVLCHGFPELAYSWRHQVAALAEAGYRAIAPDQRGYGASDRPEPVGSYDLVHLTDDLVHLLDALDIEKAVFAGHDWGGFVAWAMPVRFPERCLGVIGVNTPYAPFPSTDMLRIAFPDPDKLYILWFQQPDVPEASLEPHTRMLFEKMMRRGSKPDAPGGLVTLPDANPFRDIEALEIDAEPLLSDEEIDVYTRAFEDSGFHGPVSWYRNIDRNRTLLPQLGETPLELPCLQVTAAWDRALPPESAQATVAKCRDVEVVDIDACGHWTQQEKPDELNQAMIDWLKRKIR